jgi:glycosyltransferase involved in cell wall biosynthesis
LQVSAILNCRYEGLLLERSLDSAMQAIVASGFAGECELIVVADNPTRTTAGVLDRRKSTIDRLIYTDVSDLGLARNVGVDASRGELILFLDGDDLWSSNWVRAAWAEYEIAPADSILHPQFCVFFGARCEILVHPDWRDSFFDARALAVRNFWTALCGTSRRLLTELPYPPIVPGRRTGYEDWSWYVETAARGLRHVSVRNTAHFVRLKQANSLREASHGFHRLPSLAFAEYLAADDNSRPHNL